VTGPEAGLSCWQTSKTMNFFCLGVSVSVDGNEGGDGYSPLGDFELEGGDDNYPGDDKNGDDDGNNAGGGNRYNCRG
jgi:hypothetical protein